MKTEIRWCSDIGLYVLDRSKESCVYKTTFCIENCYNNKLYKIFKLMSNKDVRNEEYWASFTPFEFNYFIKHKRHKLSRFRFCARGEPFDNMQSVVRIRNIVKEFPDITFQLPTRAWREEPIRKGIEDYIMPFPNARVIASIDPSNTISELNIAHGWRTFFFGDDTKHPYETNSVFKQSAIVLAQSAIIRCPKTWNKMVGYCGICNVGCFNKEKKHVWLKQH